MGLFLAYDVFHACRVHAIAKRGDKSEIGDTQERVELVFFDHLMTIRRQGVSSLRTRITLFHELVMDRNEVKRTIFAIDVCNQLRNLSFQFGRI